MSQLVKKIVGLSDDKLLDSRYIVHGHKYLSDIIDNNGIYSTTEKVIGEFLGKPLYRRVYEGTTSNVVSGEVDTSMAIDNVDKVFRWSGWIQGADVPYTLPAPNSRLIKISNTSIRLDFINQGTSTEFARKSYILCVEYTKTTD